MNDYPIDGFQDSLWNQTAVNVPQVSPDLPSCQEQFDVVVVGAGFTGLNATIDMASAGLTVCVLDAEHIGFGASGRAGGQVNMGMNSNPSELVAKYGAEQAERTVELVRNTPTRVFDRIAKFGLDCDPVQNGWVQAAVNSKVARQQADMVADYQKFGGGLELLSKDEMARRSGSSVYAGGMLCPTAGTLHPLSYTRELARTASALDVKIYEKSKVTSLKKISDGWYVSVGSDREIKAGQVLLCTNGYTDELYKGLKQKLVPVRSLLMATEPLSPEHRTEILPNQLSFVDKRRLIIYMRYDRHGRLCVGDHGPMRDRFCLDDYLDVKKRAVEIFPALKSINWDFHWGGRVAMTRDHLPFMSEPEEGLLIGMAYNGRGVGLGTMMGVNLAKAAIANHKGQAKADFDLPLTSPKSYPLHAFHELGAKIGIAHAKFMDAWEARRA